MIITKTPFRMSFFGGGTDMEDYFKEKQEVHHYGSCFYETVIRGWCSFRTSD